KARRTFGLDRFFRFLGYIFPKTRWVPDDGSFILSSEDIQRRRMIMVSMFTVAMAGAYTALQISQWTEQSSPWISLATCGILSLLSIAALIATIWGAKPEPYVRLLLIGFSTILWTEIFFSGGVAGYHVGILPILPIIAAILLTTKDTVLLTILNLIVVVVIAYVALDGEHMPTFSITAEGDIVMSAFIIVLSVLGCGGAAIMLVQQSEKVNRQLLDLVEYQSHLAAHDHLTGLGNRIAMQQRFESLSQGEAFDLLLIDLDGFKAVNDTHGHNAGDFLIKTMADRLREVTDDQDLLIRLGGDEFVILLEEVDGTTGSVRKYAEYLIDIISRPYRWENGVVLRVSASIGHARYPNHGSTPSKVLSLADKALYKAKDAGKSQCITFGTEACPRSARKAAPRPQSAESKRKIAAFTPNLRQKSG
ncbi:MAG: GGDEF domain-containing protein, partial [Pseudomonadota bacterium]